MILRQDIKLLTFSYVLMFSRSLPLPKLGLNNSCWNAGEYKTRYRDIVSKNFTVKSCIRSQVFFNRDTSYLSSSFLLIVMMRLLYDPDEVFLRHKFQLTGLSWFASYKDAAQARHSFSSLDLFNILMPPLKVCWDPVIFHLLWKTRSAHSLSLDCH